MPVVKYEEGALKGAPHPLLYYDGLTKQGIPILKQRDSTAKGFDKIYDNDKTPMNDIVDYDQSNKNVMKLNRRRWWNNSKRNGLNYPDMSVNQSLQKKYGGTLTGKPVIIIGAGPSLKKNAELLKDTK